MENKFTLYSSLVVIMMFLSILSTQAQDIHYTQAHNSPLNVSPGLTGISHADARFSANYRNQWRTVPVDYQTFTGSFDKKIYRENSDKGFWSVGGIFNYDKSGDARLQFMQLGLNGSYTLALNANNLITLGVSLGGANRSFTSDDLKWGNQFNGVIYNEILDSGEDFDKGSILYFDAGSGLNYRWQKNKRTKIDIGGSIYHFVGAKNDFYSDADVKLPFRSAGYIQTSFKLFNGLDVLVNGLAQLQGPAMEIVPSAYARIYLNQKPGKEFKIDLGADFRWSKEWDAVAPAIGVWVNNWHAEASYDINLSDFSVATSRRGGLELTLQYFITTVKPLNSFKTCPIF